MRKLAVLSSFFAFSLISLTSCAHEAKNPWRLVQDPSSGEAHIYGTIVAGCIAGAESMLDGQSYVMMRPSRNRYYAHPSMKKFVTDFSNAFYQKRREYVLVGDIAQPRGGPFGKPGDPSMHASHQTGIDADIWYDTSTDRLGGEDLETHHASTLVQDDREKMTADWNLERVSALLKTAVSFKSVERIFVNAAIKRELCKHARGATQWLRKIRPWYGHDDHFHVRLVCPKNENCRSLGDTLPAGDGCDDLGWWFTDEAKAKEKEKAPVFRMPHLPAQCAKVLPQPLPGQ